jgi:hypothetical protein
VTLEGKVPAIDIPPWSEDDWNFVRTFLIAEGNLQLTGKTLGISYPTVKQKLALINRTASRKEEEQPPKDDLQNVLKSLAAGSIDDASAEEAVRKLMNMPKGKQGE